MTKPPNGCSKRLQFHGQVLLYQPISHGLRLLRSLSFATWKI